MHDFSPKAAIVPTVISENRSYDLYSRMLKDRVVFLTGGVDDAISELIISQLLFLEAEDPKAPITFYINSPGGSVTAGMAIYDTMQFVSCPVHTICIGQACSMGSFLLSAGAKGYRSALPHAQIMIHQPLGGFSGQVSDVEIRADFLKHNKEVLTRRLAEHTGKTYSQVLKDSDRDMWMTAEEALEYGLIDKITPYRNPVISIISIKELKEIEDFASIDQQEKEADTTTTTVKKATTSAKKTTKKTTKSTSKTTK